MKQNGRLAALLNRFEEMGIPFSDCAVYRRGQCVFRHRFGYSDRLRRKKADGTERCNLYSASKPITCTAALQLVEKGLIGLDDAVCDYLPEFRHLTKLGGGKPEPVKNTMTIRHLFSMTAGLTYDLDSDNLKLGRKETDGKLPTREAMKYLARDPLEFEPGTAWRYSLCHDVLAAIVEVVSGERFGQYVKKHIFDPVGMSRSTYLLPDTELDGISAQYVYDAPTGEYRFCGPALRTFKLGSEYESGGAGCISTLDDYIAFLENLRSGEVLLKRETIAEMIRPQIDETNGGNYNRDGYSYGLGVRCPKPGGTTEDYGWDGAAGAFLAVLPNAETTVFYLQHVLNSPNFPMLQLLVDAVLQDLDLPNKNQHRS